MSCIGFYYINYTTCIFQKSERENILNISGAIYSTGCAYFQVKKNLKISPQVHRVTCNWHPRETCQVQHLLSPLCLLHVTLPHMRVTGRPERR